MSRMVRRFEVLLPLRFNDGSAVPDDAIADTLLELEQRFGAVCRARRRPFVANGAMKARATATI